MSDSDETKILANLALVAGLAIQILAGLTSFALTLVWFTSLFPITNQLSGPLDYFLAIALPFVGALCWLLLIQFLFRMERCPGVLRIRSALTPGLGAGPLSPLFLCQFLAVSYSLLPPPMFAKLVVAILFHVCILKRVALMSCNCDSSQCGRSIIECLGFAYGCSAVLLVAVFLLDKFGPCVSLLLSGTSLWGEVSEPLQRWAGVPAEKGDCDRPVL